ncbi:MAG: hypothetical protein WDO15_06635 [Bacteroidota bacterium]
MGDRYHFRDVYNKDKTKTFPFALSSNDYGSMPGMYVYDNAHLVDNTMLAVDTIRIQSSVYKTEQLLTGLDLNLFPDTEFISFEDINFDGYLDLLVIRNDWREEYSHVVLGLRSTYTSVCKTR